MFSVLLDQTTGAHEQLEREIVRLKEEYRNIDEVISALNSLSGMGSIISALQIQKAVVERHQVSMSDMAQGMEKIVLCYKNAEQRITENGEGSRYTYRRPEVIVWHNEFDTDNIRKVTLIY